LLAREKAFTALYAYNDISAIGAMLAFREAGLRVPKDVSVVGFDDIPLAAFADPRLTTIRQPLQRMGELAAKTVIEEIEGDASHLNEIVTEPELVVRASTSPVSSDSRTSTTMRLPSDLAEAVG
jgi:LacI family transcriptional regulator